VFEDFTKRKKPPPHIKNQLRKQLAIYILCNFIKMLAVEE
jgi:hypothetical protein